MNSAHGVIITTGSPNIRPGVTVTGLVRGGAGSGLRVGPVARLRLVRHHGRARRGHACLRFAFVKAHRSTAAVPHPRVPGVPDAVHRRAAIGHHARAVDRGQPRVGIWSQHVARGFARAAGSRHAPQRYKRCVRVISRGRH